MKALTLTEPLAYLAGVVRGDAWCTDLSLGLRVADEDFAGAFSAALVLAFNRNVTARRDERGYWLVRQSNKTGLFSPLVGFEPVGKAQCAAWLLGLFDSEGNVSLRLNGMSERSYGRRVAFYSTNEATLSMAGACLDSLGIRWRVRATRNSASHKGSCIVYETSLRGGRANYGRFAALVGSNIFRKSIVLDAMEGSYQDPAVYSRLGQARGAETRRHRRLARSAQ